MQTKTKLKAATGVLISSFFLAGAVAEEPVSSSASYTLLPAPVGTGGGSLSSGAASEITAEITVGDAVSGGVSDATASGSEEKGGYTGQLYDTNSVELSAEPASVDEGGSAQLEAEAVMDDATLLGLEPTELEWAIISGPAISITADGLVTAGIVYQDSSATLRGSWLGTDGELDLSILNIDRDDYRSYAGDGLNDDWQVFYFGEENADAGPTENPDCDQHDNRFEFLAGIDPTDPLSFFKLEIDHDSDLAETEVRFSPYFADRTYRLMSNSQLHTPDWTAVAGTTSTDDGDGRIITDPNAGGESKFYRIEITRP